MVEIAPFKAVRYNLARLPNLSPIICPPYDVISITDYHKLVNRHKKNIVRIELPMAQASHDKYQVAADIWKKWVGNNTFLREKDPCFYGYEERFTVTNTPYFRRGFFAALKLERPGKGRIRPHERTFPKHKADRLRLMQATRANLSPIFGIFFDRDRKAQALIERRMQEKPLIACRDDKGVTHRLWKWSDPETLKVVKRTVGSGDVLIADGHHRYETAWNYAQERLNGGRGKASRTGAFRYVMTFLCSLSDPGLVIHPTHRAVRFTLSLEEWTRRILPHFGMRKVPGLSDIFTRLRAKNEHSGMGLMLKGGIAFWLSPKKRSASMPVIALHEKILKDVPLENISYGQNPRDMAENLMRGESDAVFLLPPPDKQAFARICQAGKLLPQNPRTFIPK